MGMENICFIFILFMNGKSPICVQNSIRNSGKKKVENVYEKRKTDVYLYLQMLQKFECRLSERANITNEKI